VRGPEPALGIEGGVRAEFGLRRPVSARAHADVGVRILFGRMRGVARREGGESEREEGEREEGERVHDQNDPTT
jgi:hypothetical protein